MARFQFLLSDLAAKSLDGQVVLLAGDVDRFVKALKVDMSIVAFESQMQYNGFINLFKEESP